MESPVSRLVSEVYRGAVAPTTRSAGRRRGRKRWVLSRKQRSAELVREPGEHRVGAKRRLRGDGVAACAARPGAGKQGEAVGAVIGVAIFDSHEPVRPQHGLGPCPRGPADAGGRCDAFSVEVRSRPGRPRAPADQVAGTAAIGARLHVDPRRAGGPIEQDIGADQEARPRAQARIPGGADRRGVLTGTPRQQGFGTGGSFHVVTGLARAGVALDAHNPIRDLPVVTEIDARPQRGRGERGRIAQRETGAVLSDEIHRAADAAGRAHAETRRRPVRVGEAPAERSADIEPGPAVHYHRRRRRHVGRDGRPRDQRRDRNAADKQLVHGHPRTTTNNFRRDHNVRPCRLLSPYSDTVRRNPAPNLELEQFESTRTSSLIVVAARESKSRENAIGQAALNASARALKSATDARHCEKITSATALARQAFDAYIRAARIVVRGQLVGNVMSILSLLLNVLWIVFGGLWMAVGWVIAAVIMAITIIGLPWARAAFNIAAYALIPFGYKAVSRAAYSGREDIGTGPLGLIGNIIWLVLAGWWLALGHLFTAVLLAVTIIGIPFAWAHLKLAGLALWPIGKIIVPAQDAPLPYAGRW